MKNLFLGIASLSLSLSLSLSQPLSQFVFLHAVKELLTLAIKQKFNIILQDSTTSCRQVLSI